MKHLYRTALAITCLSLAGGAQGQDFLKRLAERAAREAERRIVNAPRGERPAPAQVESRPQVGRPQPPIAPDQPARATAIRLVSDIPAPADLATQKAAYELFGRVSCTRCEDGMSADGRPKFDPDQLSGQPGELALRTGDWPIGHVHQWQGEVAKGSLMVVSQERVEGFRCRRLEYKLTKGAQSVTRPGLICWGASGKSAAESWHEVY